MKLLSWMHRKPQKDTTSSFKGSAIGSSCLLFKPSPTKQEDYVRSGHNSKLRQQPQLQSQNYLNNFKSDEKEEISKEESTEMFPGFLTIGTLSMEPITEPSTPTFDLPNQKTAEDRMPEMKYDLKLINDELEKFLTAEAEKEGIHEISRRNSQASKFSLTDNEKEEMEEKKEVGDHKSDKMQAYPLQGYLLGSSIELQETTEKTKRDRRSLQELFPSSKTANKSSNKRTVGGPKQAKKQVKQSTNLMSKTLHSKSTASTGCAADSFPTGTTLNKIKRLFHRKIHPETSSTTKDPNKFSKYGTKKIVKNSGPSNPNSPLSCSTKMGCWGTLAKGENHQPKTSKKLSQDSITKKKVCFTPKEKSGVAGTEHWINTDADYLVLEL